MHGNALLAWDYYEAAELIGEFLHDITEEQQPHVDDLLHGGHWKKALYGIAPQDINYKTGNALQSILSHFTIDPRMKVLLMVEGASEVEYIRVWCEEQGIDLKVFGVEVFDMNGTPNDRNLHLQQVMRNAHEADAAVVVVMDDENGAANKLQNWRAQNFIRRIFTMSDLTGLNHPIGGMLWEATHGKPCFEEANFSPDELILAFGDYLESYPQFKNSSVDRDQLKADVKLEYKNLNHKILWLEAMNLIVKKSPIRQSKVDKPKFALCLAHRFAKTDRPIHRLINHIMNCAILSGAYGPADPDGGYGRPHDE